MNLITGTQSDRRRGIRCCDDGRDWLTESRRQLTDRRTLENAGLPDGGKQRAVESGSYPGRTQRIATQFKEGIDDADRLDTKHFLPD
jgi:hypothetical protein